MKETIGVLYTCGVCPIIDRKVEVPVRGEESVTDWMNNTILHLMKDHWSQSPTCNPKTFKMVKIPIDGREAVGGPIVN